MSGDSVIRLSSIAVGMGGGRGRRRGVRTKEVINLNHQVRVCMKWSSLRTWHSSRSLTSLGKREDDELDKPNSRALMEVWGWKGLMWWRCGSCERCQEWGAKEGWDWSNMNPKWCTRPHHALHPKWSIAHSLQLWIPPGYGHIERVCVRVCELVLKVQGCAHLGLEEVGGANVFLQYCGHTLMPELLSGGGGGGGRER